MAFEPTSWGLGPIDEERTPREFTILDPSPSQVRRGTGDDGAPKERQPRGGNRQKGSSSQIPRGPDALQDLSSPNPSTSPTQIAPEDRERARTILDQIGLKFSENRKKGKSTAWEEYQRDLAINMNHLIIGGVMNLREITQSLMQIEEYRKQTSEHGKTPATLLAEWLSGASVELG